MGPLVVSLGDMCHHLIAPRAAAFTSVRGSSFDLLTVTEKGLLTATWTKTKMEVISWAQNGSLATLTADPEGSALDWEKKGTQAREPINKSRTPPWLARLSRTERQPKGTRVPWLWCVSVQGTQGPL